jgi:hypothetical protein
LVPQPVWSLCRRGRSSFAVLRNEAGLFGYPTLKLVTILTPMFRLTTNLKNHMVGYPRTVFLRTVSPLIKVVKLRTEMVG